MLQLPHYEMTKDEIISWHTHMILFYLTAEFMDVINFETVQNWRNPYKPYYYQNH